jgi:chaperonin GroEL (HSP60 family)
MAENEYRIGAEEVVTPAVGLGQVLARAQNNWVLSTHGAADDREQQVLALARIVAFRRMYTQACRSFLGSYPEAIGWATELADALPGLEGMSVEGAREGVPEAKA